MSILYLILLFIFLFSHVKASTSQTWIKAGYWYTGSINPIPNINSALFTHLICAFAYINPSTHELILVESDETYISSFASTVKKTNPSVKPLLLIWTRNGNYRNDRNSSNFLLMTENPAYRKSFIESSIKMARVYGFEGLDLHVTTLLSTKGNMTSLGILFNEWRIAVDQEKLILTMGGHYSPELDSVSYSVDSIGKNFDWVHIRSYDYHTPLINNFTAAHTALYDPSSPVNTDYGINEWVKRGLPASQLVLGLAYHGYVWNLVDPKDNGIGAPAKGMAITRDGSFSYDYIRRYMRSYVVNSVYNSTYVTNYCKIGSFWIGYDDVEAIRNKVAYARDKGLLGYNVWQLPNDHNWELSKAAAQEGDKYSHHTRSWMITLCTIASFILLLFCIICHLRKRIMSKVKQMMNRGKSSYHNQQVISFADIREATDSFSEENKLGEGGYGPVYKGIVSNGQEIAIRVEDFGIAKSFKNNEIEANTDRIVGTYGCIPPEYVKEGLYSRKYDVYSFGVLLLQIISGKKNYSVYGPHQNLNLLEYAYVLWKEGTSMEFMDPSLDDESSTYKLTRCMQVALLCVEDKWTHRPSMLEVSAMLRNEYQSLPRPRRPAFSIYKYDEEDKNKTKGNFYSVDIETITLLLPR
ncbi:hypothetical protein L1987_01568 [Smallanthus sonchifolius]|uniref:Uncharacterized protein n=1 Tax=Smallanthus sonchifolius TaxID=185202 RepID=A0ACB9K5F1_9ASTR|nr:hypothetical protein L1987_01568 [Smallanthus sonchifolius]